MREMITKKFISRATQFVIPALRVVDLSGLSFPLVGNHSEEGCWTSQHDKQEKDCPPRWTRLRLSGQAAMTEQKRQYGLFYVFISGSS